MKLEKARRDEEKKKRQEEATKSSSKNVGGIDTKQFLSRIIGEGPKVGGGSEQQETLTTEGNAET